jgi:hypothetical protein
MTDQSGENVERERIVQRIATDRGVGSVPADEREMALDLIRCWVNEVLDLAAEFGRTVDDE